MHSALYKLFQSHEEAVLLCILHFIKFSSYMKRLFLCILSFINFSCHMFCILKLCTVVRHEEDEFLECDVYLYYVVTVLLVNFLLGPFQEF